jgi:glutamine synthetase
MVHTLAQRQGLLATFMPKPFTNLTGNGCHLHMSLWDADTDQNLFEDPNDSRGLGLSDLAYNFLGGLLKHAKAYIAVSAPTVNSYKRLITGAPSSGATWAPAFITYGRSNRTQMIRVPAPGRFEDRTVDGATNPYLTATVILAAGLDGIENKLDPGDPNLSNMYEVPTEELKRRRIDVLPSNLLDATRNLERDEVLREALGRAIDEDYVDYFVRVKQREWKAYHDQVSDWEVKKYLQLV